MRKITRQRREKSDLGGGHLDAGCLDADLWDGACPVQGPLALDFSAHSFWHRRACAHGHLGGGEARSAGETRWVFPMEKREDLSHYFPDFSAFYRLSKGQVVALFCLVILGGGLFLFSSYLFCFALAFVSLILFLPKVCALFFTGYARGPVLEFEPFEVAGALEAVGGRVYTVLVPLYKEASVLTHLLSALDDLVYPRECLDIKLLIEEGDEAMIRALRARVLQAHYEVVVVPAGWPRTKPRALNYGLARARGAYVTVFDAEDMPSELQLLKAVWEFDRLGPDVSCLQGKLTFYNASENWLTRQYTLEYGVLYGLLAPFLSQLKIPFPLGGTSNHFRREVLEAVGGWDSYNVTEDADLGIRLARLGYRAVVFESVTFEEANLSLIPWFLQRSRWLKGFLQTWFVHMRAPLSTLRQMGGVGFFAFQGCVFGVIFAAIAHPIGLALFVDFWFFSPHPKVEANLFWGLALLTHGIFFSGYIVHAILARRTQKMAEYGGRAYETNNKKQTDKVPLPSTKKSTGVITKIIDLVTVFVYWPMLSIALVIALWSFLKTPHAWYKTPHGQSKISENKT